MRDLGGQVEELGFLPPPNGEGLAFGERAIRELVQGIPRRMRARPWW
jgi:hypothetical protein